MILMKQYRYTSADVCGPGYTIKRYYHRFYAKKPPSRRFPLSSQLGLALNVHQLYFTRQEN